jgi:O-antigen/teichoic acid export membrane protein
MLRQVLRDSSLVLIGDAFTAFVAGFLLVPLYTHHMPTAEYGIVVTVAAIGSVLSPFLSFTMGSALMRYYYEVPAERRAQYVGTLAVFLMLLVGATSGLWLGAVDLLHRAFFANLPREALLWALALVLSTPFRGLIDVILRVEGRFSTMVVAALCQSLLLVLGAYLLVGRYQLGLHGWIYTNLAAPAITTLALAYVVRHQFRWGWMKPELTRSLRFSWPLVLGYLTWFLLNRSNIIILQSSRSLAEAGIFGVTYQFGLLLMVAGQAVDKVVGPLFYRDIASAEGPGKWARLTTVFIALIAWLGLAVCLFSRPLFTALFPADYLRGLPVLPAIVWAFTLKCCDVFFSRGLYYGERTGWLLLITGATGLLNIGLNIWLIPLYGIQAAGLTTLLCFALTTLMATYCSQRAVPLPYAWKRLAVLLLVPGAISGLFWHLDHWPWHGGDWALRLGALVASAGVAVWAGQLPVSQVMRDWRRTGTREA